jgi:hypothetical protein
MSLSFNFGFKESLSRTFYLLGANKIKILFFMFVSAMLQAQIYSLEFKAKVTGDAEDIAQAVASGAVFLSAEMLIGLIIFSVVAGGMLKGVLGRKPIFATSKIMFGSLSSLIVALSIATVILGGMFQMLHGNLDEMDSAKKQEAAVGFLAVALPLIMGIPYAISAKVMSQLTLNRSIKASNPGLRNKAIRAISGYQNGFVAFFVAWKKVFTEPYFLLYAITFVLFVSPELYLPNNIKESLIPVVLGVIGHTMVILMYLTAFDDGLVRYLNADAVESKEDFPVVGANDY